MTAPNAGSASVSIVPDLRGFFERLSADLLPGVRQLGDEIGRLISQGMVDQVAQGIRDIDARLALLGSRDVDIRVRLNDDGSIARAQAGLSGIGGAAAGGIPGVSALGLSIAGFGPAAIGAAAVAIPAIIAIGAAATGAIAGLGVLGLGFSGIQDALSAAGQKTPGTGAGSASSKQSAAIQAQQQQITAQQATQAAADQLTSAVEAQHTAELNLATAQRQSTQAQVALSAARVQAKQDLQDLGNSVKDNALAQRQAAITLADAKAQLLLVQAAPGAGLKQYQQQVAQAQLAFDQAKQNVAELALTGSRLATQSTTANRLGVAGAPGVVAAQQNVADAHTNVQQAQQATIDSAHKLAEAQANITITARQNALAAQAAAISMVNAAGGVNAFAAAMAKLNPIQRQFVDFLLKLKPLFDEIKLAASGFLPGLEQGITNALPLFQPVLGLVSAIAKALGGVFTNIGTALAGPEGQKFIAFLTSELPGQIKFLGDIAIQFGRIFSGVFEQFAPLIKVIDDGVVSFLTNLGNTSQTGGFAGFIKEITPLVGPVFKTLGALGDLLAAAFKAILPAIGPSLTLIQTLAKAITPLLAPIGLILAAIIKAVTPLVPVLGQLLKALLPPLVIFVQSLARLIPQLIPFLQPFVHAFILLLTALTPILPAVFKGLTDALAQLAPLMPALSASFVLLVGAFAQLLPALVPLLPPLVQLAVQVVTAGFIQQLTLFVGLFSQLLIVLLPVLTPILNLTAYILNLDTRINNFVNTLTGKIITSILGFGNTIKDHLLGPAQAVGNFFQGLPGTITSVISQIGTALGGLPDKISGLASKMTTAGKALITALFNGLGNAGSAVGDFAKGIVNDIIDGLNQLIPHKLTIGIDKGLLHVHQTIDLFPNIPHLAAGGIIPAIGGGLPFIGGEAGVPEAVIPLNQSTLSSLANAIAKPLANVGTVGRQLTNTNNFYGMFDAPAIAREVNKTFAKRGA